MSSEAEDQKWRFRADDPGIGLLLRIRHWRPEEWRPTQSQLKLILVCGVLLTILLWPIPRFESVGNRLWLLRIKPIFDW